MVTVCSPEACSPPWAQGRRSPWCRGLPRTPGWTPSLSAACPRCTGAGWSYRIHSDLQIEITTELTFPSIRNDTYLGGRRCGPWGWSCWSSLAPRSSWPPGRSSCGPPPPWWPCHRLSSSTNVRVVIKTFPSVDIIISRLGIDIGRWIYFCCYVIKSHIFQFNIFLYNLLHW